MTSVDPAARRGGFALLFALILLFAAAGCDDAVNMFPEPATASESAQVMRQADWGCIVAVFSSYPLRAGIPPDGVRQAVIQAIGNRPCSAASFYWGDRALAERWIGEQMAIRRNNGQIPRLILAGHGLGGAEAGETARNILFRTQDAEVVLLLTVDAIKGGKIEATAAVAGSAIAAFGRLPNLNMSLTTYDVALTPDGRRFWSHINYYQDKSQLYHGIPMPGAENHRIEDWTGLLNHGDADDFVFPLLVADLRAALERGSQ